MERSQAQMALAAARQCSNTFSRSAVFAAVRAGWSARRRRQFAAPYGAARDAFMADPNHNHKLWQLNQILEMTYDPNKGL